MKGTTMKQVANPASHTRNRKAMQLFTFKPTVIPDDLVLIVDTREQRSPLLLEHPPKGLCVVRDTLHAGDYGIRGFPNFAIEKKYRGDLYPYCSTEREKTITKMHQFRSMIQAGGWVGLVIEEKESDIFKYQEWTKIDPECIRGALLSFEIRYGVHVYFSGNSDNASRWIVDHACRYYKIQHEV
jgi:ERCC4-type nuclease